MTSNWAEIIRGISSLKKAFIKETESQPVVPQPTASGFFVNPSQKTPNCNDPRSTPNSDETVTIRSQLQGNSRVDDKHLHQQKRVHYPKASTPYHESNLSMNRSVPLPSTLEEEEENYEDYTDSEEIEMDFRILKILIL